MMLSMTSFEFADVILVPFPFTDQSATKKRPAIVISSTAYNTERLDLIIMGVISQIKFVHAVGEIIIRGRKPACSSLSTRKYTEEKR